MHADLELNLLYPITPSEDLASLGGYAGKDGPTYSNHRAALHRAALFGGSILQKQATPPYSRKSTLLFIAMNSKGSVSSRIATARSPESSLASIGKHLYTIYLFTASDFKTIMVPKTVLGTFNALSGTVLVAGQSSSTNVILSRIPLVFFWAWINLLPFNINNQRQPEAALEDGINKAWRPMPSKRITPSQAKKVMISTYVVALSFSWYLHAFVPSAVLLLLGIAYNDLGGADRSCIVRNILNAGLYLGFITGATMVAYGGRSLDSMAWKWFGVVGTTVFLTVHMQDIPDQEGDRARGRNSVPLVIGDGPARWTIAVTMTACSMLLPAFWQIGLWGYAAPTVLGAVVIVRAITKRAVVDDEVTWRLWNVWMITLYLLPYLKSIGA